MSVSTEPRGRFGWLSSSAWPPGERQRRWREALAVVLAVNSGATDAIGFLALGGAFTSVMTGNMVLLGISAAGADVTLAVHTAAAIACFIVGCALGTRVAGVARPEDPVWPAPVTRALALETTMIALYAVGWWVWDADPGPRPQLGLLVINALALGVQSSTVQRFGMPGLSTTYLTGTLTTLVVRLASGHRPRAVVNSGFILGGLVTGAAIGAVLILHAPVLAPLVQLASLAGVLTVAVLVMRPRGSRPARA